MGDGLGGAQVDRDVVVRAGNQAGAPVGACIPIAPAGVDPGNVRKESPAFQPLDQGQQAIGRPAARQAPAMRRLGINQPASLWTVWAVSHPIPWDDAERVERLCVLSDHSTSLRLARTDRRCRGAHGDCSANIPLHDEGLATLSGVAGPRRADSPSGSPRPSDRGISPQTHPLGFPSFVLFPRSTSLRHLRCEASRRRCRAFNPERHIRSYRFSQ